MPTMTNSRCLPATTLLFTALVLSACGYSEDEWQAELARYEALRQENAREREERERTAAALEESQAEVAALAQKLKEMGVDVDALTQRLAESGTENQQLSADLDQVRQALADFRERAKRLEQIRKRFEELRKRLEQLTRIGIKVEIRHNRMVIRLPGDVLFASGEDKLRPEGVKVVDTVAGVIRGDGQLSQRYFQVAGHTDTKPLRGGRFGDNWGLSTMRARRVLLRMIAPVDAKEGGGGLNPARLHAAGYGETDPVADNGSDAGRQQNRRVELVLMPNVEEMLDLRSLI